MTRGKLKWLTIGENKGNEPTDLGQRGNGSL